MNQCQHSHTIGDNYGISCHDCGTRLAGHGYNGHERICKHEMEKAIGGAYMECIYCGATYEIDAVLCQDDYEFFTNTGQYAV